MECKFFVGQKVVCIKKDAWVVILPGLLDSCRDPAYGEIVTIVGFDDGEGPLGLILDGYEGASYAHYCFRPATDITIFHETVAKVKNRDKVTS